MTKEKLELPEGIELRGRMLWMRFMINGKLTRETTTIKYNGTKASINEAVKRKNARYSKLNHGADGKAHLTEEEQDRWDKQLQPAPLLKDFIALPDPKAGFAGGLFWTEHASKEYRGENLDHYRTRCNQMLKYEPLANKRLDQINDKLLKEYITQRRHSRKGKREGEPLKPGALIKDIGALGIILGEAVAQKFLAADKLPELPDKDKKNIKSPGKAMREEEEKIYFECATLNKDLPVYARLMIDTGLEPGPMRVLDWELVVWTQSDRYPYGYINGKNSTKNVNRPRDRAMTPELHRMLKQRHKDMGEPKRGPVFPSPMAEGDGILSKTAFEKIHQRCIARIRRDVDYQFRPFRLYDFRHTFLTRYWNATKDIYMLKEAAGWNTQRQAETYVHQNQEDFKGADLAFIKALGEPRKRLHLVPAAAAN